MADDGEAAMWTTVAGWHETNNNAERDKRKKVFTPLLDDSLRNPHSVTQDDCVFIVTAAACIVDIIEPDQRLTTGCLFALALRRTHGVLGARSVHSVCGVLLTKVLTADPKGRLHRRALAMDVIARALQLYPGLGRDESFGDPGEGRRCRFVEALPTLLQDLAARRAYTKRGTFQTKGGQEEVFDEIAAFRIAICNTVEVLAVGGVISGCAVLLPLLSEAGYKARDYATKRAAVAANANCLAAQRWQTGSREVSPRVTDVVGNRDVSHQEPVKAEEKKRFVESSVAPQIWTWDDRIVRHFSGLAARCVASPNAADAHRIVLARVTDGGPSEAGIDAIAAVAASVPAPHIGAALGCRLLSIGLSGLYCSIAPQAMAAIAAARQLVHWLARGALSDAAFASELRARVPGLLEPLYGGLQQVHRYHHQVPVVIGAAMAFWVDVLLLQQVSGCLNDADTADAIAEAAEVTAGRDSCALALAGALVSLASHCKARGEKAAVAALVHPFRGPLVSWLANAIVAAVGAQQTAHDPSTRGVDSSALVRQFFNVVDANAVDSEAQCYTITAIDAVASEFDPLDPRLLALMNDRAVIARLWASVRRGGDQQPAGDEKTAEDPTRTRLTQALLVTRDHTARVALGCVLQSLS